MLHYHLINSFLKASIYNEATRHIQTKKTNRFVICLNNPNKEKWLLITGISQKVKIQESEIYSIVPSIHANPVLG